MGSNFRKNWIATFALMTGVFVSSCTIHIKEPIKDVPVELGKDQAQCLSKATSIAKEYELGLASEERVNQLWSCISDSFRIFVEKVHGESPDNYTPTELRKFLERYFLRETKISDELLVEAMELKRAFVGGSGDLLTRAEIDRTQDMIKLFRRITLRLRPFFPMTPAHIKSMNQAMVDAAINAMVTSATELGIELEKTNYPYTFRHLDKLLDLVQGDDPNNPGRLILLSGLKDRIVLMRALKGVFFANDFDADVIQGNEWKSVLSTSARWYGVILQTAQLFDAYKSWSHGPGLDRLNTIWVEFDALMKEAFGRSPNDGMDFDRLDKLIDALKPEDIPVTQNTLKYFLGPLIKRILGQVDAQGFDRGSLDRIGKAIDSWYQGQRFLIGLFLALNNKYGSRADKLGYTREEILSLPTDSIEIPSPEAAMYSAKRLMDLVGSPQTVPLFMGDDTEIAFLKSNDQKRFSFHDLSELNWMNVFAEVPISSYTTDPVENRFHPTVTVKEFAEFYANLRDMGIELKVFDPFSQNPAEKRFLEGRLFTFASTGSDHLNVQEGTQLLQFLISGKRMAERIHSDIEKKCGSANGNTSDRYGHYPVKLDCYLSTLFDNFSSYYSRMPRLTGYYEMLKSKDRYKRRLEDFKDSYQKASRYDLNSTTVNSRDTEKFAMVAHYVESIYRRFDVNEDDMLDRQEAEKAYSEVYHSAIEEMVKKIKPDIDPNEVSPVAHDVFMILLDKGELGNPPDADIKAWRDAEKTGPQPIKAYRNNVYKIFVSLGALTDQK